MRIIVQTFVSSNNETVTKNRQDISQIRGTSIFLRNAAKGLPRDCIIAVVGTEVCHVRRLSGPAAVAVLSRWRLSVKICARMFYDTFDLTLGFIAYDDVYIFSRKILGLLVCTVVFLRISVSFTTYLVRDNLISKWNKYNCDY